MNANRPIQSAIDKLTAQREESDVETPGATWESCLLLPLEQADVIDSAGFVIVERCARIDADLIVTLHRTIDAQLVLLKHALVHPGGTALQFDSYWFIALNLANAINGDTK